MLDNSTANDFSIQFWGVRDGISTPGKDTVRYGGNTSCVELRLGDTRLIFDAGSGLRVLGNYLLRYMPVEAHIFFSNCHWDRLQGFPFFTPAFIPINHFHIYGAATLQGESMQQRLSGQMLPPNFPVPIQVMGSKLEFHAIEPEHKLLLGEAMIESTYLVQASYRSIAYRINWQGQSVVYATAPHAYEEDQALAKLLSRANILVLAAPPLSDHPFEVIEDRWHSRLNFAKQAEVKSLVFSSYSPDYDDQLLDRLEKSIQASFPTASLAREGMVLPVV